MFDIGFGEIFLIAVVALLVLGPERLPKAARFAGLWVRRARAQWYSVKAELENELADDELKRSLKQTRADLMEARDSLAQGGAALQRQFEDARNDMQGALQSAAAVGTAADHGDDDIEPPLSSVTDALEQPELPLDHDDGHDDHAPHGQPAAAPTATQTAAPRPDERR
ncbi:Sec-independent protein translocase protein TatB [Lysobacter terrae]